MTAEEFKQRILPIQSAMQLVAERMLGSDADAEDIVQDVFLALWQKRDDLEHIDNIKGYCIQATRSRCIDHIRKLKIHAAHEETIRIISDDAILEEVDETQHRSQLLQEMLSLLPETQKKIITLKYFEDYDTAQISQALGISQANVYTTLSRAIHSLKEKIKNLAI